MAAIATQTIELDLIPGGVSPFLYVSQGDYGTRNLVFNLMLNGQPYTIPSSVTTVSLEGITKGGNMFNVTCTKSGSTATASLTADMTADIGMDICQIVLKNGSGERLGTANFFIVVELSPGGVKLLYGNVYWSELSKSWAVGSTDLRSDEETNNSKYWSEISKSWAVGGTDKRTGEDTDNAKYWSEVSKYWSDASVDLARSWAVGGTGKRTGEDINNAKYYAESISDVASQVQLNANEINVLQSEIDQYISPPEQDVNEVVNARIGVDGTVYPNLGEAIRKQTVSFGYISSNEEIYFSANT